MCGPLRCANVLFRRKVSEEQFLTNIQVADFSETLLPIYRLHGATFLKTVILIFIVVRISDLRYTYTSISDLRYTYTSILFLYCTNVGERILSSSRIILTVSTLLSYYSSLYKYFICNMKMEAVCCSETLVPSYHSRQCHNSEDCVVNLHHCGHLGSYRLNYSFHNSCSKYI
jgi:hypothetical protein